MIKQYLIALIEEKGIDLDEEIQLEGHFGLTWEMVVDFLEAMPEHHEEIRRTLVTIDFKNGDVFHYLNFLSKAMVESLGY